MQIIQLKLDYGYYEGVSIYPDSDYYYDGKVQLGGFAEDNDITEEEALEIYKNDFNIAKNFLQNTANGYGWRPMSVGWVSSFFGNLEW